MENMNYWDIPKEIGVKRGDKIYLSSSFMQIALMYKKNGQKFDGNKLIDAFVDLLGDTGTLLIPTFSYEFCRKGIYDIHNTRGVTGALGNIALQRDDFMRTNHPIHSFAVWGDDQKFLCELQNLNSFGDDSPFSYMLEQKVKQIIIGTDYTHAFTFSHYGEVKAKVPYRFIKRFTGKYIDRDGSESVRTYEYPARDLSFSSVDCSNKIGKILEKNGIAKKYFFDGFEIYSIDLAGSFPYVYNDAYYNMCENLYDFSIERKYIWSEAYVVNRK